MLNYFRLHGVFGLYIEVDSKDQKMYGWYKGRVIESYSFSLNESIENIQLKRRNFELTCKEKIKKIKLLKSKWGK